MLTSESLPLSDQLMIIHTHDLKMPHLERLKQLEDTRSCVPQVGSIQHYAAFVQPVFYGVPLDYKWEAPNQGREITSNYTQNHHSRALAKIHHL
jgi:hypothetical protein